MTAAFGRIRDEVAKAPAPVIVAGLAFLVCYWQPMVTLGRGWWNDPEAGHGLLLFPVSVWQVLFLLELTLYELGHVNDLLPVGQWGLAVLIQTLWYWYQQLLHQVLRRQD